MVTNKSAYFLPQLLGLNHLLAGFKNSYIGDVEDEDNDFNHLYILMDDDTASLDLHEDTVLMRQTEDGRLYKIKVNDKYVDDIIKFYNGKYSKISEDAKQLMINYCGVLPENSLCYNVLYKTKRRKAFIEDAIGQELEKDMEYMSIINVSDELYDNRTV